MAQASPGAVLRQDALFRCVCSGPWLVPHPLFKREVLVTEVERGFVLGVDLSSTVGPIYRAEYQPDVSDSITASTP
jgi:hypothetical protein